MTSRLVNRPSGTIDAPRKDTKRGRGYVSEFTEFMDRYLEEHPEVVRDRSVGFGIYWNRKVDFKALGQAARERAPDDSYGFAYSAWWRRKDRRPSITEGSEPVAGKTPVPK